MTKFIAIEKAGPHNEDIYICKEDARITRLLPGDFLNLMCKPHDNHIQYRCVPFTKGVVHGNPSPDGAGEVAFFCCHTFMHAPQSVFNGSHLLSVFELLWDTIEDW